MAKIKNSVNSKQDLDLKGEIKKCAEYLLEKQRRDADANKAQYAYGDFLDELDSVKKDIVGALKRLDRLSSHFDAGPVLTTDSNELGWDSPGGLKSIGMRPFMDHQDRLLLTRKFAGDALAEITNMISEVKIFHSQKTRALDLQKSATRLAYSIVGDRIKGQARKVAIQIIDVAKLDNPSQSKLSEWLKEFKAKDAELALQRREQSKEDHGNAK